MNFRRMLSIACGMALLCTYAHGGDYTVEIEPSKKIIYIDQLRLPANVTVDALLNTLPELMHRGDILFDNYDIQYDGKSVGESRDVIVLGTKVEELEKIEITTSSVATQSRNGQSGTVNLVPKKIKEGFGGEAGIYASTDIDAMPDVDIDYKKDKLALHGHASFEYYHPEKKTTYIEDLLFKTNTGYETKSQEYMQETARLDLKYAFNGKNTLKAWLLESYGKTDNNLYKDITTTEDGSSIHGQGWYHIYHQYDTVSSLDKTLLLNAKTEYEHLFAEDSKFTAFAGLERSHVRNGSELSCPTVLDGELKYEGVVWKDDIHLLKIKPGVNITYSDKAMPDNSSKSLYVSPYFDCNYHFKGLWINATARYQIFDRHNSVTGYPDYDSRERDLVGNINALWQIRPHHALNATVSRNIIRPSDNMLRPGYVYYPTRGGWVLGNPTLTRSSVYAAEMGYITDHVWGAHSLIFNVNIGYNRAADLIEERMGSDYDKRGVRFVYTTYDNSGIKDIAKMNFSTIYKYDMLTLSLAGNLFCNFIRGNSGFDKHLYYNLSANSILNFSNGWAMNATVQYNSRIITTDCVLGDRLLATAKLSKRFNKLSVGLEIFDIFDYLTEDYSEKEGSRLSTLYDLYGRAISLSLFYKFGAR